MCGFVVTRAQRFDDFLHRHAAGAFDQQGVAWARTMGDDLGHIFMCINDLNLSNTRGTGPSSGRMTLATPHDTPLHAACAREGADRLVQLIRVFPELEHVPEGSHPRAGNRPVA